VSPPSIQRSDTDREALAFDAGQTVTSASATLRDLTTGPEIGPRLSGQAAVAPPLESVALVGNVATVIVSGLIRDRAYELSVNFTGTSGLRWTATLIIECVA